MTAYPILILTSEHHDDPKGHRLVYYGKSDELGAVELIFDQTPPLFFVDREEKLPALDFSFERKQLRLTSMSGRPVDGLYFGAQHELRRAADRFRATGVRHFEADVRPEDRFLMERYINGCAVIAGEATTKGKLTTFRNPKIKPGRTAETSLRVASLDIETGVASGELYSIAVHLTGDGKDEGRVLMLADRRETLPENLDLYPSEKSLLTAFFTWFREADPDLIIGWHVIGFDLMYLERKCQDLGMTLDISRNGSKPTLVERPGRGYFASISGRVVLDGPPTLRANGHVFPNYKLETVAQEVLGAGKLITPAQDKIAEIERQFREDKPALARYNLEDCALVTRIFNEIELTPLLLRRSFFSGALLGKLNLTQLPLDHYYLPKLHREGMVAPNAEDANKAEAETDEIGLLQPVPGVFQNAVRLEIHNLYPTLIRIFKIEPLARVKADEAPIDTPAGRRFSSARHLLPAWFEALNAREAEARQQGDKATSQAIEALLRLTPIALQKKTCRFYHPELADALNKIGVWLLQESKSFLESKGAQVLLADAASMFIAAPEREADTPEAAGKRMAAELKQHWRDRLQREYGATSHLQVELGGVYRKLALPRPRVKEDTSKRQYAGLLITPAGKARAEVIGMERVIPGTWTALATNFLETLFAKMFADEEVESWIIELADSVKAGALDDKLVYKRRIKKPLDEYSKASPPPHVKAARLLDKPPKREIAYLWTKRGPVPVDLKPSDIDYDHYLSKQIAPIADLLLSLNGKSFKSLTEPEQISLF